MKNDHARRWPALAALRVTDSNEITLAPPVLQRLAPEAEREAVELLATLLLAAARREAKTPERLRKAA